MIGSIRGVVLERSATGEVLCEVAGIGYRVLVPVRLLPGFAPGAEVFVYVHHHIREDAAALYGFATRDERDTFEALLAANGVGPKLALAICSVHPPEALRRCLAEDDVDALVLVPGVGKRTAQRLLIELKARLDVPELDLTDGSELTGGTRATVRDALAGLGYSADEVRDVLTRLPDGGGVEDLLRDALRALAGGR